jgi:hypothetical protein
MKKEILYSNLTAMVFRHTCILTEREKEIKKFHLYRQQGMCEAASRIIGI